MKGRGGSTDDLRFKAVVVGGSAGGVQALTEVLSRLPVGFPLPVLVAQHLSSRDGGALVLHMGSCTGLSVLEASDKTAVEPGSVYIAPADYHLLVERNGTLALSVDPKVNWSRPSLDVLFESAARVWTNGLIGVILSGANEDGARGMRAVRDSGGLAIAQNPSTAEFPTMPQAAIEAAGIEILLSPEEIGDLLRSLAFQGVKA